MFESEAFAKMIVEGDATSLKKWQQMSLDNAATLEAIINSAKQNMPTIPVKSMVIGI